MKQANVIDDIFKQQEEGRKGWLESIAGVAVNKSMVVGKEGDVLKKELWGGRRKLSEKQLHELERIYAHFHRVLGPLLVELAELSGTVWLEEAREHLLTGEDQENVYARAIYPVTDLEPYRERLAELTKVQAAGLELLGHAESPKGLLPPRVVEAVQHVRISQHPNFVTQVLSYPGAVERLEVTLATTRNNLRQHELYATTYDPKREQIEVEIGALEEALAFVRASPKETFRFRTQVIRIRPYIYPLVGDPYQIDTRKHGLILAGPNISVRWADPTRKTRSDKKQRQPFLQLDALQVYLEREWQAAS